MANILLAVHGSTPPLTVGINWAPAFVNSHNELGNRFSRRYGYRRALNEGPQLL